MMKSIFKRKKLLIALAIVLGTTGAAVWLMSRQRTVTHSTLAVARGEVSEEVSVTGKVRPSQNLDSAFERTGRVAHIAVKVGDLVAEGQELMRLDDADMEAQLAQAIANTGSQEAKLQQLKAGTRPEDIALSKSRVSSAQKALEDAQQSLENVRSKASVDLTNAYSSVPDTLTDAYTKSDDAVRNQTDALFVNDDSDHPTLSFSSFNSQGTIDVQANRARSTDNLNAFAKEVAGIKAGTTDAKLLDAAVNSGLAHLNVFLKFLNGLQSLLSDPNSLDPTTLNTYKTAVAAARSTISAMLTSVNKQRQAIALQKAINQTAIDTAQNGVNGAQSALDTAQRELALKEAGATAQDIAFQQSQVEQARANASYYRSQLEKAVLKAPFAGKITKIVPVIGDIINPNTPVVSIIGSGNYQMEAYVTEADIAKVKVGNMAKVTLDAYGTDVSFGAKVVQTDISSTVLEGVATYKTTLQFENEDARILPGLTANIDILSNKKESVLFVPTRNIESREGKKYVKLLGKGDKTEEREVTTGLRGSNGRTEIISGLSEGELVITD